MVNDIQDNTKIDEKDRRAADIDDFYRGAYRRGARRKNKGTVSLVITIVLLSAIVLVGLLFVVGTFLPFDLIKMPTSVPDKAKVETVEKESDNIKGFSAVTDKFDILTADSFLADGEKFAFAEGILSHIVIDLDKDGADELLMVSSDAYSMPTISVFENNSGEIKRNAYYSYTGSLVKKNENAKSEIYISEADGKKLICVEKYSFDDFSWYIEVLNYNDGFERMFEYSLSQSEELTEENKAELSKCMIEYTPADYSEGSELKMNGDADGKTLLCSFESNNGEIKAYMN